MKHSRTILTISSFAIALASGVIFAAPSAQASELLPSLVNTAVAAKEAPTDVLTTEQRISILKEIISSAQDEISTLTDKLKDLQLDDQWSLSRDQFISTLATSSDHYAKLNDRLAQKDISLEEVKTIAKDLKDWREATYSLPLKEAGNLILIFQTENVRTIIEARDAKISNDLKKLDRQKLVNTDTLKKYLSQAEQSIQNARDLTNKAKDIYFTLVVAPLQPQKDEVKAAKTETATDVPAQETSPEQSVKTPTDKQDEIRDLAKDSLMELKTAYELFFKMNDRIRK